MQTRFEVERDSRHLVRSLSRLDKRLRKLPAVSVKRYSLTNFHALVHDIFVVHEHAFA